MLNYGNVDGRSGVTAYEPIPDGIRVEFNGGAVYRYTNESAGVTNIDEMCRLAAAGTGLNSFINRVVRMLYEQREA